MNHGLPADWKLCCVCSKRFRFGPPFDPQPYRCLDCLIALDAANPPGIPESSNDLGGSLNAELDEYRRKYGSMVQP